MEVIGPASALRADRRGRRAARPARELVPGHADHDLRRRHQRGAARPHLGVRPPDAEAHEDERDRLDFATRPTTRRRSRDLARKILEDLVTHERLTEIEASRRLVRPPGVAGPRRRRAPRHRSARGVRRRRPRLPRDLRRARGDRPDRRAGPDRADDRRARTRSPSSATTQQRSRWLPEVGGRRRVLTLALQEPNNDDPTSPSTRADVGRDGWRLVGAKHCVHGGAPRGAHARAGAHRRRASACSWSTRRPTASRSTRSGRDERRTRLPRRPRRRRRPRPLGDPVDGTRIIAWTVAARARRRCASSRSG